MIILDMDGTLLDSNQTVLESSKVILRKLKQIGKTIVIATGRCVESALQYLQADFVDYLLASNGAIWYSMKEDKIIKRSNIESQRAIDLLCEYRDDISYLYIMNTKSNHFLNVEDANRYLQNNEAIMLSIHFIHMQNDFLIHKIGKKFSDLEIHIMQDSFSDYQWIDIVAKNNDKGKNIKELAKYLNIDIENTICFGDSLNDIEMFKVSKVSVAMGNALEEVKEVATHITDSNDKNGIYNFLNEYFFGE